ncbi:2-keto-4-pentenoate hydratase [Pseudoroseomonas rhizosphaerae]|uniref:2-keto-4-pentenoate hydratase n=1 Tax=Teichococcus rhizosphaerae TaxID=1335062 RepID=A0A2C7AA68_9PROT|nr:fumarylacetoacetate hydrolase family protein [Pseudoroseomonas rhizosphaerae]PHK95280.1 2-keto-4-pentenoate hydratase [Pseudoroseomonas rhizosphaerae]
MATDLAAAAAALLEARRSRQWLAALPEGARPATQEEAVAIQALVAEALGPIGGWKVGAATPEAMPGCAPLNTRDLRFDDTPFSAAAFNITGIEAEIGFRLGADLPPREKPYSREEVMAAVASLHPIIEIVDTRFKALNSTDPLSHVADQINHGALVVGPALESWRHIDPPNEPVRLTFNDKVAVEHVGGNTAGEPIRLLQWLANEGARRLGGLKAGMVVTTGSCTGLLLVPPGTRVRATFRNAGTVETAIV